MARLLLSALFLLVGLLPSGALAQTDLMLGGSGDAQEIAPATPGDLQTPADVNALVSRLSDSEARAVLITLLNEEAEAAATEQGEGGGAFALQLVQGLYQSIFVAIQRLPVVVTSLQTSFTNFWAALGPDGIGLIMLALLGGGLGWPGGGTPPQSDNGGLAETSIGGGQ